MDISLKQEESRSPKKSLIWYSAFIIFLIPVISSFFFATYIEEWRCVHEPFHAVVESVGAFSAIILSLFII
ncbi:MAG: hypothetical protein D3923_10960, partial [Candidatus Electrothrix sp. AR3]|nr:hypothetical protein [Candidatus Electrothrix sp. AR3]